MTSPSDPEQPWSIPPPGSQEPGDGDPTDRGRRARPPTALVVLGAAALVAGGVATIFLLRANSSDYCTEMASVAQDGYFDLQLLGEEEVAARALRLLEAAPSEIDEEWEEVAAVLSGGQEPSPSRFLSAFSTIDEFNQDSCGLEPIEWTG